MPDATDPTPVDARADAPSFEDALARLETIVEQLETDEASLEEALSSYEEGMELARRLLQRLDTAELRIQELALE